MRRNQITVVALISVALPLLRIHSRCVPQLPTSTATKLPEMSSSIPITILAPTPSNHQLEFAEATPEPATFLPTPQSSPDPSDQSSQFAMGKPVRANGLADSVRWLDAETAARIPFGEFRSRATRLSSDSLKRRTVGSREEAMAYLEVNVSMARRPTVASEDGEFFYFSGGNTAYPVKDFSQGMAINKATGEIIGW